MVQLIGLIGKKGSGKDTIAVQLREYGYQQYAFADPLKRGIQQFFDLSDGQLYDEVLKETVDPRWGVKPRQLFQIIGTEIFQHSIHQHLDLNVPEKQHWTYLFEQWYKRKLEEDPDIKVVVSDIRFPHELECVRSLGGKIIKIIRQEVNHNLDQHCSEALIDEMSTENIDYLIENDGTLHDFYSNLDKVLRDLN